MIDSPESKAAPVALRQESYGTSNLLARFGADTTAAVSSAIMISPFITIIDRAIIENSSGRNTLGNSVVSSFKSFVTRPHLFLASRPFRLILALYSGTYVTANSIDTLTSTTRNLPASTVTAGATKFVATTTANISICLYKDSQFARMFGTSGPVTSTASGVAAAAASSVTRRVPLSSYLLFGFRDCLTVFASFNVPVLLAPHIPTHLLGPAFQHSISQQNVAQFAAPLAVQIVSTPIHLLGLDLYNRPTVSFSSRLLKVSREWGVSCLARMGRVLPAYGVGGVLNSSIRANLMKKIEA